MELENTVINNKEECLELKNIMYKTMLINGNPLPETKSEKDLSNLDKFLESEKINNVNEPWCKLNKTVKTKKLVDFVEKYKNDNNLDNEETKLLASFLKDCIDRKKLQRVKDVVYDKTNGSIKEIPALSYTKANKHFTLKNVDKRVSTLKSLAPKKGQGTIKNKNIQKIEINNNEDSSSDNDT